jgi:hypothetical protein
MDLYYIFLAIFLIVIGYYSLKYLLFILIGMIISFYISYKYIYPIYCSIKKNI